MLSRGISHFPCSAKMADEQLSLTVEQLAESVRTSMTREDAHEPLQSLTEIIEKEVDGYLHEVCGLVFRSLVPAFVMTDADFKTPASLPAPTKAMYMVKDSCIDWLVDLIGKVPAIAESSSVDRVAYRRRMHMASMDDEEDEDAANEEKEASEQSDDGDEQSSSGSDMDDENTPPNASSGESQSKKSKTGGSKPGATDKTGDSLVILDPVVALLERMSVRCPDKAEWRRGVCEEFLRLSKSTRTRKIFDRYVSNFLLNLMQSDKAAWRSFACEACPSVIQGLPDNPELKKSVHTALLHRCNDSSAIVRSAALKSLASVLETLVGQNLADDTIVNSTVTALCVRGKDEKPFVRRAAVSVFDNLVGLLGLGAVPLDLVEKFALDESLIVRKASVTSIVGLMENENLSTLSQVTDLYARTVLPMITDVETSVVEKVVESFEVLVVSRLICSVSKKADEDVSSVPRSLLMLLSSIGESRDNTEFARRILRLLARKFDSKTNKQLGGSMERLVSGLLSSLSAPRPGSPSNGVSVRQQQVIVTTVLAFMEELSATCTTSCLTPSKLCLLMPILIEKKAEMTSALVHLLRCVVIVMGKKDTADMISQSVVPAIQSLVSSPLPHLSLVHDSVRCINTGIEDGNKRKSFFQDLLNTAESHFDKLITDEHTSSVDETTLGWFLTLVGELATIGYMPSAKGLTAIEAIGTNRVYRNNATDHCSLPPSLRAAAMVSFGKICLQKESIAKRAVSKFAAHLAREEHPIVRNNVLIVLGDLCVVYTGLVDQYLPWVTTCLSDPSDLIRFQAAVVVSSLLAEDYIKFKGQIVFRLLYLLSDPNPKLRLFVESVFSRILFLRHSGSLKTLFAETVCAINGFTRHPAFQGAIGNREFLLTTSPSRRREIYEFMLTNVVTADQKFNAMMQLCHSLLAAFVDEDATNGTVQIPEREEGPAGQVIIDTLWLISHRGLKLSTGAAVAAEAATADPGDEDKEQREKKQFEAALQKKTVVENIVPLLIQLNSVAEQKRSPISRYVRDCLRELVRDYKDEVTRIIHADTQLAQELLFDLGVTAQPEEPLAIADTTEVKAEPAAAGSASPVVPAPVLAPIEEEEELRTSKRTKKGPAKKRKDSDSEDSPRNGNKKKGKGRSDSESEGSDSPATKKKGKKRNDSDSEEDNNKSSAASSPAAARPRRKAAARYSDMKREDSESEEVPRASARVTRKRKQ